ncbi:hypothetical protein [Natronosalvus vescus]|uniref:hypothetical protein n=1 Tax=Natronosalvus vescus TaxID=2953881 RepID=UPI0020912BE2|nr:hypothetical protein [Natronosalvus vescus]
MDLDLTRRQLLAGIVGGGAVVGGGRATYNVFLGYDRFTGTNLKRQDLDPLVAQRLRPSDADIATVDGHRLAYSSGVVSTTPETENDDGATVSIVDDPADAAALDDELGLEDAPLEQLVADLGAIDALELGTGEPGELDESNEPGETREVRFTYHSYPDFFAFVDAHETRPYTVNALRGYKTADPALIEAFADADPADPKAVAEGLVDGFREHTSYDIPRYVAGSIEDNVLFRTRDLRQYFETPTDFDAILADEDTGLFCYELTRRSVEALQAVSALEQTTPVFGGFVKNTRHKHVYTILASVVRDEYGGLVVPVTFLDYTHTTLYDDLRIRRLTGEGLDAYDSRHRATSVAWYH